MDMRKLHFGKGGSHIFCGASTTSINCVQVHFLIVYDIAAYHATLQEMDIIMLIINPCSVKKGL